MSKLYIYIYKFTEEETQVTNKQENNNKKKAWTY